MMKKYEFPKVRHYISCVFEIRSHTCKLADKTIVQSSANINSFQPMNTAAPSSSMTLS